MMTSLMRKKSRKSWDADKIKQTHPKKKETKLMKKTMTKYDKERASRKYYILFHACILAATLIYGIYCIVQQHIDVPSTIAKIVVLIIALTWYLIVAIGTYEDSEEDIASREQLDGAHT